MRLRPFTRVLLSAVQAGTLLLLMVWAPTQPTSSEHPSCKTHSDQIPSGSSLSELISSSLFQKFSQQNGTWRLDRFTLSLISEEGDSVLNVDTRFEFLSERIVESVSRVNCQTANDLTAIHAIEVPAEIRWKNGEVLKSASIRLNRDRASLRAFDVSVRAVRGDFLDRESRVLGRNPIFASLTTSGRLELSFDQVLAIGASGRPLQARVALIFLPTPSQAGSMALTSEGMELPPPNLLIRKFTPQSKMAWNLNFVTPLIFDRLVPGGTWVELGTGRLIDSQGLSSLSIQQNTCFGVLRGEAFDLPEFSADARVERWPGVQSAPRHRDRLTFHRRVDRVSFLINQPSAPITALHCFVVDVISEDRMMEDQSRDLSVRDIEAASSKGVELWLNHHLSL